MPRGGAKGRPKILVALIEVGSSSVLITFIATA